MKQFPHLFSTLVLISSLSIGLTGCTLNQNISHPVTPTYPIQSDVIHTDPSTDDQTNVQVDESNNQKLALETAKIEVDQVADQSEPIKKENWSYWPAQSSLSESLHMDLSIYKNRPIDEQPLNGLTVIIDPGHGGSDPGAIVTNSNGETVKEKDLNLKIATPISELLQQMGATVIMTRTQDEWVSLYHRIGITGKTTLDTWETIAKRQNLDLPWIHSLKEKMDQIIQINQDEYESGGRGIFTGIGASKEARMLFDAQANTDNIIYISVHCNSYSGDDRDSVKGTRVFYTTNDGIFQEELQSITNPMTRDEAQPFNPAYTRFNEKKRSKLAQAVYDGVTQQIPDLIESNRNNISYGNYAFTRENNIASILLECGYMTSTDDLKILQNSDMQQKIAQGVAQGIYHYFCQ